MAVNANGQSPWDHGKLVVSDNNRFLNHEDGTPFFYMGDTAWNLFKNITREDAELYLEDRRQKGFTVIQAVALDEWPGPGKPNAYEKVIDIHFENHAPFGSWLRESPSPGLRLRINHRKQVNGPIFLKL